MKRYERIDELLNELYNIEEKQFRIGHTLTQEKLVDMRIVMKESERISRDIEELKYIKDTLQELEKLTKVKFNFFHVKDNRISFTRNYCLFSIKVPYLLVLETINNLFTSDEKFKLFDMYTPTEKLGACIGIMEQNYTLEDRINFMNEEI